MNTKMVLFVCMVSVLTFLTACSSIQGIFGKSSKAETKSKFKIEAIDDSINRNEQNKMNQVAVLASGVDYALNKVVDKEPTVSVAYDINKRVVSLAGKPDLDAEKEMWKTVDQLLSDLSKERDRGIKSLEKKDQEIFAIQSDTKLLASAKDSEISKYMKLASDTAMLADTRKAALDQYQGWFGLKAVFLGLSQFIKTSAWVIGIGSILFLLLRLASMSNPIAASIFSIFNMIGSWAINIIKVIVPKSVELAGHTATSVFESYKKTMVKLIDCIQVLKDRQAALGEINKKYTLDELMVELDKSMGDSDKKLVTELKQKIGYK